jgi:hypothetical protein
VVRIFSESAPPPPSFPGITDIYGYYKAEFIHHFKYLSNLLHLLRRKEEEKKKFQFINKPLGINELNLYTAFESLVMHLLKHRSNAQLNILNNLYKISKG